MKVLITFIAIVIIVAGVAAVLGCPVFPFV